MSVDSEAERGARMKSVGLLSTSYTNLYKHMQFLESQVRWASTWCLTLVAFLQYKAKQIYDP